MNRTQKIVTLTSLILILFSIIFPPYKAMIQHLVVKTGWGWIFNLGMVNIDGDLFYQQIRFDVLFCEIFAIVILAGILFVSVKKK